MPFIANSAYLLGTVIPRQNNDAFRKNVLFERNLKLQSLAAFNTGELPIARAANGLDPFGNGVFGPLGANGLDAGLQGGGLAGGGAGDPFAAA